jgi:hypothetical protein
MVALDYDGRRFSSEAAETDGSDGTAPVGSYHQSGDLVWAEFAGGSVRTGRLVGTCGPDGVIEAAYVQLLDGGELAAGRDGQPAAPAPGRAGAARGTLAPSRPVPASGGTPRSARPR